jgi:arylsulfatase A-like enzyme
MRTNLSFQFLDKLMICAILSAFILSSCSAKKADKPNVVIILTDDQGWGDLSVNGNTTVSTPNIDKLSESGVTFDRFYVCAVCSPTRAEMLTGRYHVRGGVYSTSAGGERLDLDETTIAEVFKGAGYATAAYGKWHNGMQAPYHPNARGFEDYYGFCSGHWGNYFDPMLEHNGEIVKGKGFIIDDLTNHGLQFIEANRENPFFLYLPYNTPHSPMQVPDKWWNKFENKELPQKGTDSKREKINHSRAALAMCENIDWNVGRVMAKLDELNLSENTIVIYFSDNGPNGHRWNGGMKGTKGSTDEGGVRSPMFMKWEGTLDAGKRVKEIAGAIDLLPTLTDLAGIDYTSEKPLDGVSLKPLLLEDTPTWTNRFIINNWKSKISIRSQQYRLGHEGQLFDMVNDPNQKKDISSDKPEIFKSLSSARERWEREVFSELPKKDVRPFVIGHPELQFTQIPARDGKPHGNVRRSNRYPNCSYFTNWKSTEDKITWEAEVAEEGNFEVVIYYTCPSDAVGSSFELSFGDEKISGKITEPHSPQETGMENDRFKRVESYVKEFKPLKIGAIHLKKGAGTLELKATEIPGSQVMDFRLLLLNRID